MVVVSSSAFEPIPPFPVVIPVQFLVEFQSIRGSS